LSEEDRSKTELAEAEGYKNEDEKEDYSRCEVQHGEKSDVHEESQ
jgi:hypothetical protein